MVKPGYYRSTFLREAGTALKVCEHQDISDSNLCDESDTL
jgi:hypothetical protein